MSYSKFLDLREVVKKFSLGTNREPLFLNCKPIRVSSALKETIDDLGHVGLVTEKDRSERIVWPILKELSKRNKFQFAVYSGFPLNVDVEKGLNGECDFLLGYSRLPEMLEAPIFSVVEAKKQDMDYGMAQCTAQMIGARLFNEQENYPVKAVFGAATTGREWRFLRLENNVLTIDENEFSIVDAPRLLGYMQCIFDDFLANKKLTDVEN